jgi:hypothetical protein
MVLAEADTAAARRGLPRRRRWRLWALLMLGVVCVVLAILAAVASRYQPIGNGEDLGFAFPGLPAGHGFRIVNNLGGFHQDVYVPPQRGTFALVATITNNGTHPVTIVRAAAPQGSGLWLAGKIRYSTPGMGGSNQIPPPASRILRNAVPPRATAQAEWRAFAGGRLCTRVRSHSISGTFRFILCVPEDQPGQAIPVVPGGPHPRALG